MKHTFKALSLGKKEKLVFDFRSFSACCYTCRQFPQREKQVKNERIFMTRSNFPLAVKCKRESKSVTEGTNFVPRGPFCHARKKIPVADQKDRGLWERD